MKYLLIALSALFLLGCSSKNSSFLIPTPNVSVVKTVNSQIGVVKVKVPSYLNSDKILVKDGLQVKEINANFASSPDKLFTQNAIITLKKALNNPNVFLYPWDVKSKKGYIVEIVLDDFIYSNGKVLLSGSYFIKEANGRVLSSKNFAKSKVTSDNAQEIVKNLGELFNNIVLEIAQKIAR